jgi:hypothetical protein
VPDLLDLRSVGTAGILASEIDDVCVWPCSHVAGEGERRHESSAPNFLPGIHVRNALHQEKSGTDLQVITLIPKPL